MALDGSCAFFDGVTEMYDAVIFLLVIVFLLWVIARE